MTTPAPAPQKSYCISSLAEGQEAWLVGAGWECRGLWRWVRKAGDTRRMPARRKVFWDTEGRVPREIGGLDRPREWRPLAPFRGASAARVMAEPCSAQTAAPAPIAKEQLPSALERRVLTAFKVDRALPDRERGMLRVRANWPETGAEPGDYPKGISTRFKPTPADLDDYLVVMAWVAGLDRRHRRVLFLRSFGFTWRSTAERLNRSGEKLDEHGARRLYRAAIAEVAAHAARAESCGGKAHPRKRVGRARPEALP